MSLPVGTITFLFTDIEGSTKLWQDAPDVMQTALARHDALLRHAIETQNGTIFKTVGDGVYAAFGSAPDALAAALAAQRALTSEAWTVTLRVRMAIHTGLAEQRDGDYFGNTLNRVARLLAAGHGGQVLLSAATQELTRDYLPGPCQLRDLGEVPLRDLARPEHVFQLLHPELASDFPALKSLDNPDHPNNLPQQVTSLIGRERESAEVLRLLQTSRLLTLTGSGGCGKTRLSLQVAADILDACPDGVWFIDLAPLTDPGLVPQTIAHVLKIQEQAGKPLLQTLTERLQSKKLALVLDNCEHLLAASAALADTLIRALPQIRLLATSREPLNTPGETVYRVPSLTLPDPKQQQTPESLSQFEAVRLFIDRALLVAPAFAVTNANAPALAAICHRLDGIPLALELAAARTRSLPLEQIAAWLDNRFLLLTCGSRTVLPRQQTLRALIDWSYSLLTEAEQTLFCRLSVFAGGWTLEAAEGVCSGDGIEEWEVLDLLTSLTDKSLVVYSERDGGARYRFLETVRQYATDRRTERNETDTLRVRHCEYYLTLAKQMHGQEKDEIRHLSTLETEHDNLRTALTTSLDNPETVERLWEGIQIICYFRRVRGYYREGNDSLQATLVVAKGRTTARGVLLSEASSISSFIGDDSEARRQAEESVSILRERGELKWLLEALRVHGMTVGLLGDFTEARLILEDGLEIDLAQGGSGMGFYADLGAILFFLGEYDQAETFLVQGLALIRQAGHRHWEAILLCCMGRLALVRANHDTARSYFRDSLEIGSSLDVKWFLLWHFLCGALLAAACGQNEIAARLLGAHDALHERIGSRLNPADQPEYDRLRAALRATLGMEAFTAAYEAGRALDWAQAVALAQEILEPSDAVSS